MKPAHIEDLKIARIQEEWIDKHLPFQYTFRLGLRQHDFLDSPFRVSASNRLTWLLLGLSLRQHLAHLAHLIHGLIPNFSRPAAKCLKSPRSCDQPQHGLMRDSDSPEGTYCRLLGHAFLVAVMASIPGPSSSCFDECLSKYGETSMTGDEATTFAVCQGTIISLGCPLTCVRSSIMTSEGLGRSIQYLIKLLGLFFPFSRITSMTLPGGTVMMYMACRKLFNSKMTRSPSSQQSTMGVVTTVSIQIQWNHHD